MERGRRSQIPYGIWRTATKTDRPISTILADFVLDWNHETFKPEVNVEEEVKKQLDEKVSELLQKANEKRKQRREENLNKVIELARRKQINNQGVRDLLQVSQSTASNYLSKLVKSGRLKVERRAKATVYFT